MPPSQELPTYPTIVHHQDPSATNDVHHHHLSAIIAIYHHHPPATVFRCNGGTMVVEETDVKGGYWWCEGEAWDDEACNIDPVENTNNQNQKLVIFIKISRTLCSMATEASDFKYEEEYIVNSKGLQIFTCRWLPIDTEPKALIFLNHGYAMECSVSMKGAALRLVKAGFAVYGIDNQGHGKSSGLQGYIPSFDDLVNDCSDFFTSVCERKENKRKMRILLGESMGGGMVLRLHRKNPEYWDGGVLVAPMCKIADDIKPPQFVINVLTKLTKIIPTWKIVPGKDIIDVAFRDPKIREEVRNNPLCYKGRFRLKTANELLNVSLDLENRLQEVTFPFFVGHGEADTVTDPSIQYLQILLAGLMREFQMVTLDWRENKNMQMMNLIAQAKQVS
ncbi:unnamed protein product [Lactuca saligna]|uniref:Serine aminopeptidase S33 domain-containing protein n=1 Tax=Lactuca saligna TaxID=75948 RepID=A0AA36A1F8_LACSI|nr:unnamed protein product [Lactuca saligna]